jgi:membrane protease YdiL (CAAX protease family)
MEPEIHPPQPEAPLDGKDATAHVNDSSAPTLGERIFDWLSWTFIGPQGLRAGWSVAIFVLLFIIFASIVGFALFSLHLLDKQNDFTASKAFFEKLMNFLPLLGAAALMALIERRRSLLAYNLTGPRCVPHFFSGLAAGFLALSALVGALVWGGWLHFGPVALSGAQIFSYAAIWGAVFLLTGCVEEGLFRCYLLSTLTRGINFWWALGTVGTISVLAFFMPKSNGSYGVYAAALVGLIPCLWLHLKKSESAGFWHATWVTSFIFGSIHVSNPGENWIGIFAAALIGFVFCVSVRVTGTAWWAIGCHAAWDWAETYFYGTADSGLVAPGHYLSATPLGNALWSGGADGPEGSLLVLGVILLLLAALLVIYGRRRQKELVLPVAM